MIEILLVDTINKRFAHLDVAVFETIWQDRLLFLGSSHNPCCRSNPTHDFGWGIFLCPFVFALNIIFTLQKMSTASLQQQ